LKAKHEQIQRIIKPGLNHGSTLQVGGVLGFTSDIYNPLEIAFCTSGFSWHFAIFFFTALHLNGATPLCIVKQASLWKHMTKCKV